MSRGPLRDDLALAAYAVSLGYELRGHYDVSLSSAGAPALFNDDGIPHGSLQFIVGDVHVWATARGWRTSRMMPSGVYDLPTASHFREKLKAALDEGARNWRGSLMPIGFLAPKGMLDNKPPHGSPCTRCGLCCIATLCPLARHVFNREAGPCPALVQNEDRTFACGMTIHGTAAGREAAMLLVGTGTGCDARVNGEPVNDAFNARLAQWDIDHADEIARAKATWGMR